MVPDLVGNHVGFGKVPFDAEALSQLVVKAEVDVHALVAWAVKRSGFGVAIAATGAGRAGEQH